MSDTILEIIAGLLIAIGIFFEICAVFGVFRLRYVLNRMHAAAIGDTLAILFVLAGLMILSGFTFTSLKLGVIIVFFWLSGPVSSHLIANLTATVDRNKVLGMVELIEDDKTDET